MPTEISLSRKVGADLINIKTDLEPEAAVKLFADVISEVAQLVGAEPQPQVTVQQAAQNVQTQLGGQYVQPQHTDPRAPGYAQGPPPFEGSPRQPNHYTPGVGYDRQPAQQGPAPFSGAPVDNGVPAKVCAHGKMVRFEGVSKKNGQPYVRWDCPDGQKPCVKWGA